MMSFDILYNIRFLCKGDLIPDGVLKIALKYFLPEYCMYTNTALPSHPAVIWAIITDFDSKDDRGDFSLELKWSFPTLSRNLCCCPVCVELLRDRKSVV